MQKNKKDWLDSAITNHARNTDNPIPWLTYEAIIWLLQKCIGKNYSYFEWGAGASTKFFKEFDIFTEIRSIEHNLKWAIDGVKHVELNSPDYPQSINKCYDVVVIDGRRRVECMLEAIKYTNKYLVLDNSERERYTEGHNAVPKSWKRYDFAGYGRKDPWTYSSPAIWQTTIYEKRD